MGENLLSLLRDGKLEMTNDIAGVLLRMVDTVRALLAVIEETGGDTAGNVDVDGVVTRLQAALDAGTAAPSSEEPAAPASSFGPIAEDVEDGDIVAAEAEVIAPAEPEPTDNATTRRAQAVDLTVLS